MEPCPAQAGTPGSLLLTGIGDIRAFHTPNPPTDPLDAVGHKEAPGTHPSPGTTLSARTSPGFWKEKKRISSGAGNKPKRVQLHLTPSVIWGPPNIPCALPASQSGLGGKKLPAHPIPALPWVRIKAYQICNQITAHPSPAAAEHLKQSLHFLQLLPSYLKPNETKQKKKPCWPPGRVREGVGQNTPDCALFSQLVPFFHTGFLGHFRFSFLWHSFPGEHHRGAAGPAQHQPDRGAELPILPALQDPLMHRCTQNLTLLMGIKDAGRHRSLTCRSV